MAITSVDSYLLEEIEPVLKAVLKKCYIIDEVLKDFNYNARESFKEAFCGEDAPKEVTIGFSFPEMKNDTYAHYVIQLGQGEEIQDSLGGIQGVYTQGSSDTCSESSVVYRDGDELVIKVSEPIAEVLSIEDISFAEYDNVHIEENMIKFRYDTNESLEEYKAIVTYVKKTGEQKGLVKGFTVKEQVTIVGMSNNVDVARCLDAILKMILITMRGSIKEQQTFQLQNLSFGDLSPLMTDTDTDSYIWGRPIVISYTTSVDMDYDISKEIKEIVLRGRNNYG